MADDAEAEEVEWLKEQFDPGQHVAKGTYIKIQVCMALALTARHSATAHHSPTVRACLAASQGEACSGR